MPLPQRKIALALMAHPDDAESSVRALRIRLADAGWEIHIATTTPGDCGSTTENRWAIGGRRTAEASRAAALIGAVYHCLDKRDGFVVYDKPTIAKGGRPVSPRRSLPGVHARRHRIT